MKKLATTLVAAVLGWQLRRLYRRNQFKVVAVAGSIGKTSTKLAVATVLSRKFRVRSQDGNYNHLVSVPLVFFGQTMPNPYNPLAWLGVFAKNELKLLRRYRYEVVVVEVGTDGPGQLAALGAYLKADIGVVTSIAPEHMEFFHDLDAVAAEEFSISNYSSQLVVNKDLCAAKYLRGLPNPTKYSRAEAKKLGLDSVSDARTYSLSGAICVGRILGMTDTELKDAARFVQPPAGRLRELEGVNGSTIIDDTYNASPEAVKQSLKLLYDTKAPQRIAILGNMNELGDHSAAAHTEVGQFCDPSKLDLVVTIGPDANKYLASAALSKGCRVKSFDSPYNAGEFVKGELKPGAVILAKGSQNKVFAEEAVKQLLANPADTQQLVRQSRAWLKIKQKAF